jgi:hypothetical protein
LCNKLALNQPPDKLDKFGWECGSPLADVKRLVEQWHGGHNWRRHPVEMNRFMRDRH